MNYSGADMQIAEWKDRQQNTADQLARALARIRELEAALRDIPRYAFPGESERWEKIDALLGNTTPDAKAITATTQHDGEAVTASDAGAKL